MMTETRRLPRAVMETLVLIALHQPVTRSEIEDIRGVSLAQTTMDLLLESGLVKPWGRKNTDGPANPVEAPRPATGRQIVDVIETSDKNPRLP